MQNFWVLAFVIAVIGADTTRAGAQAPDAGPLSGQSYISGLDAICAMGQTASEGCDAIRQRPIVDATDWLWPAIGRVNFASINVRQHCTGTLVSERHVITAAHCLYNFPRKAWIPAQSLQFAAGYQRGAAVAVASGARYLVMPDLDLGARDFRTSPSEDLALIELDAPIGRETGYFDLIASGQGVDEPVLLPGYSGLRPHVLSVAQDCGTPRAVHNGELLILGCSAMQGDSGAPILVMSDGVPVVMGVLSSLATRSGGQVVALAARTRGLFDALARLRVDGAK